MSWQSPHTNIPTPTTPHYHHDHHHHDDHHHNDDDDNEDDDEDYEFSKNFATIGIRNYRSGETTV